SIKQNDEVSISSYLLNGKYPNNENFIGTNEQMMKIAEVRRMPTYKSAILRVCQLQLKICSKLIEIASPSCPTLLHLTTSKPSTLKRLAGRSILLHPCYSSCNLAGICCLKTEISGDIGDNNGSCYHQVLPNELIRFLRNGAVDYD
ncbi:hypothetical protein X798_02770, partial [Onchocerca flexuosa]